MALPTTGPISLGQVRTELKTTGPISLGQTDVRTLAGKTSGPIKMSDLYGKSSYLYQGNLTVGHYDEEEPGEEGVFEWYGYNRGFYGNLNPLITSLGDTITQFYVFHSKFAYGHEVSIAFTANNVASKYVGKTVTFEGIGSVVLTAASTYYVTAAISINDPLYRYMYRYIGKNISVTIK